MTDLNVGVSTSGNHTVLVLQIPNEQGRRIRFELNIQIRGDSNYKPRLNHNIFEYLIIKNNLF